MQDSASLLPLVIGVTGHRNPAVETVAALERAFEERLGMLDALAPNTPFVLLTPLALGCDRIAARVAMRFKRSRPGLGIEIIAVLPFALDDYRQDFAGDAADAAEFEELLAKVDDSIELPRREGAATDGRGFVTHGDDRDLHYRRLGLFVALQSQVTIAMWDGVRNNKVGGTAEVVDFCLGVQAVGEDCGIPFRKTRWLLVAPDKTPVLCIPTQREGGCTPTVDSLRLATGGFTAADRSALQNLDELNANLVRTPIAASPEEGSMFAVEPRPAVAAPWSRLTQRCRRLDTLAGVSKKRFMRSAWLIPLVALLGVVGFQWYSSWGSDAPRWAWAALLAYLVLLATAVGIWWSSRRAEWVFVHARALAEALRIQIAWTGSGLDDVATDRYLARRSEGVDFLRSQVRAANLEATTVHAKGGFSVASSVEVGKRWIAGQKSYFAPQGKRMVPRARRSRRFESIGRTLNLLVLLFSVVLFFIACAELGGWSGVVRETADSGSFIVGVALAIAVAFDYWRDAMLDQEDLQEAARMHGVFARAEARLSDSQVDPREVVRAMGLEALDEHADWFGRHQDRLGRPNAG